MNELPDARTPPFSALAGASGTFKSIPLDEYLSEEKGSASLAAIVIGNVEGTRTPDGGKTRGFYGYRDPDTHTFRGGSFSGEASSDQYEEADRRHLAALRGMKEHYLQAAKRARLDPNNALLASTYFDCFTQSPSAAERFLTQLPSLKASGITPESVTQARVSSWVEPRTQRRYLTSNGTPVGDGFVPLARKRAKQQQRAYAGEPDVIRLIREEQARRVKAMVLALNQQGLFRVSETPEPLAQASSDASQSVFESIWDWLWGTLQGDFNKEASLSQIAVNTVLGLIPLVDQVLDVRDIIAGLKDIIEYYMEDEQKQARHESVLGVRYEIWIWINVFIIALGCIPEVGSAVKGVLRALIEALVAVTKKAGGLEPKHLQEIWARLLRTLGSLGISESKAASWLRQLSGKLFRWMDLASEKIQSALKIIQNLLSQAEEAVLSRYAGWVLDKRTVQELVDGIRRINKAVQQAYTRLDKMKVEVNQWLRAQLGKVLGSKPPDAKQVDALSDGLQKSRATAAVAQAEYRAAIDDFRAALQKAGSRLNSGLDPTLLAKMAQVGYHAARNGIRRFDVFRREQALKKAAERINFASMTAKQLDAAEAAFQRGVQEFDDASGAGRHGIGGAGSENSFKGTLRGEQVDLPGVLTQRITYTKRAPELRLQLRRAFDSSIKAQFVKSLLKDEATVAQLKRAGFSDAKLKLMREKGVPPRTHRVHHKLPLDDGGDNDFSNLVLIKEDPHHQVITNAGNSVSRQLRSGESVVVDYPIVPGVLYPP